jgi:hypothetical protein
MHAENCNLMTQDGSFFDITHTFKVGSATYHVLGLRKDRPTYRNSYYIFNCSDNQHESTNDFPSKSVQFKRSGRASEPTLWSKHRPLTARHTTTTTSIEDLMTNQTQNTKSTPSRLRTHTGSPKKVEIDTKAIQETLTKAIRNDRQLLIASLRKEMNIKKRSLLRSIKKEKETLLQATVEANKKEEIIRLLEEQKNSLTSAYEQYVNTTNSSIDTLKQTLIETLETQHNTSQSIEQLQLTLIQTIEQEVQKIARKNEEILRSTSDQTNAINQSQSNIIQKLEHYSNKKQNDDATLNRLFAEQKQALNDVVVQQQQTLSLDLLKQTVLDALNEQQSASINIINNAEYPQQSTTDTITNISSEQILTNSNTMPDKTSHSLPRMKSGQHLRTVNQSLSKNTLKNSTDQHLFKVSIRSPEPAHLYAKLVVDGMECSRRLHTLCQRDVIQKDLFNCYVAPPIKDGPYEVTIYAKTNKETGYRAAISIRLPGSNIFQPITFPMVHESFEKYQCILIQPLQRLLRSNEQVLIHMIVPGAHLVKIRNGDDNFELDINEYKKEVVKKKIRVRGDVYVTGCWDKKTDSTICVFNMI